MFTFSFSSAFAVDAKTITITAADLASAKVEAINTISNYAKLENYDVTTQSEILFVQADAIASVQQAGILKATQVDLGLEKTDTLPTLTVEYDTFEALWKGIPNDSTGKHGVLNKDREEESFGVYDILNAYTKYVDKQDKTSTTLAVAKTQALNTVKAYINSLDYSKFSASTGALLKAVPGMAEKLINEATDEFAVTAAVKEVLAYVDSISAVLPDYAKVEQLKKDAVAEVKGYANLDDYDTEGKAVIIKATAIAVEAIQAVNADLVDVAWDAVTGLLVKSDEDYVGALKELVALNKNDDDFTKYYTYFQAGSYLVPEEAISVVVKAYKAVVATQVGNKLDPAKTATLKYQAEYKAYVALLTAITGNQDYPEDMELAAGVKPASLASLAGDLDSYGKYLGFDGNFYYATAAEAQAAFNKAIAAVNKIANEWYESTTVTNTTVATAAEKTALKQEIKAYAYDNGTTYDLLNALNAEYAKAVVEIDAATTKDQISDIRQKYIGSYTPATYAFKTSKGVYLKAAKATGTMPTLVANASLEPGAKVNKVAEWTKVSQYIEANFKLDEVYMEMWDEVDVFIQVVNAGVADKLKSGTLFAYGDTTATASYALNVDPSDWNADNIYANSIELLKRASRAYYEKFFEYGDNALTGSVADDLSFTVTSTNDTELNGAREFYNALRDVFGKDEVDISDVQGKYSGKELAKVVEAYNNYSYAVATATSYAQVREAQAALLAATKDIKTEDEKELDDYKKEVKAIFDTEMANWKGTKSYSQDVQDAIDYLYADVIAFIDKQKTKAGVDKYTNFADDEAYAVLRGIVNLCDYTDGSTVNYILSNSMNNGWYKPLTEFHNYLVKKLNTKFTLQLDRATSQNNSQKTWSVGNHTADAYNKSNVTGYTTTTGPIDRTTIRSILNSYVGNTYGSVQGEFAQYDAVVRQLTPYKTATQALFEVNYPKFTAAMEALGTPDGTNDTYKKFDAAKKAFAKVYSAGWATTKPAYVDDAQVEAIKAAEYKLIDYYYAYRIAADYTGTVLEYVTDKTIDDIYTLLTDNTTQEDGKFVYGTLAGKTTGTNVAFLDEYYSSVDQLKIKNAYQLAKAKYTAATTLADKQAAVDEFVATVTAIVPKNADKVVAEGAANLAALKAYASQFFAQYESKAFTSAATNKGGLRDDVVAAMSTKFSMADVKVTTKKILGKGIQVTCDVVPGATEYKFWRATSKGGNYKLMLTKTTNTYTNTLVTKGVKYFYKVTAVVNGVETEMTTHTGVRTW